MGEENKEDERLSAIVTSATTAGFKDAVADPDTWTRGLEALKTALQEAAKKEAGNWLLGWLKWVVGKLLLGLVIVFVLWYTGGLPAVLGYLKVKP